MEKFVCRGCKVAVAAEELADWPFCCVRCQSKNAGKIIAAQRESIAFWQQTCCEKRSPPARQRFSESIERGLKALNL